MEYFSKFLIPIIATISTILVIQIPSIIMMIYNARTNLSEEKRNINKIALVFIFINFGTCVGLIFNDNSFGQSIAMLFTLVLNIPYWISSMIVKKNGVMNNFFHIYAVMPVIFLVSIYFISCLMNNNCFDVDPIQMFFMYLIFSMSLITSIFIYNVIILVKNYEVDYIVIAN